MLKFSTIPHWPTEAQRLAQALTAPRNAYTASHLGRAVIISTVAQADAIRMALTMSGEKILGEAITMHTAVFLLRETDHHAAGVYIGAHNHGKLAKLFSN
jgi:hypothetical protein